MDDLHTEKENKDPTNDVTTKQSIQPTFSDSENGTTSALVKPKKPPCAEDFELLKPISRGAFGKVFLGRKKTDLNKLYALKVMKKADLFNKNLIAQVTTERDALAMVHSPFVVELYYSLQSKQNIYLVMEYLVGGDVKSMLAVYGYLGEVVSCFYAAEVTLALEHLHSHGIIHRDLKPDNMLISASGHIKLTDFGLSKVSIDVGTPTMLDQPTPRSRLDKYRTPGQILSLKSSLAFSIPKPTTKEPVSVSRTSKTRKSILGSSRAEPRCSDTPMSPLVNGILLTPETQGPRTRSSHQRITLLSMMSPRSPVVSQVHSHTSTPPVKSLTPTLQSSQNSRNLTADERRAAYASIQRNSSTMCEHDSKDLGNVSLQSCSISSTDEVFSSTRHDFKDLSDIGHTPGDKDCGDLSCLSHDKVSSRQESLNDNTPQLHRTMESVWNSYAARNLRSFREGSHSDISLNPLEHAAASAVNSAGGFMHKGVTLSETPLRDYAHVKLASVEEAPGESSFSASQGSTNNDGFARERNTATTVCQPDASDTMLQPSRKRSYEVLTGDTGSGASSHTGLTQEVRVMILTDKDRNHRKKSAASERKEEMRSGQRHQQETSMDCDHDDLDRSVPTSCKIRITSAGSSDEPDSEATNLPGPLLSPPYSTAGTDNTRFAHLRPFLMDMSNSLLASSPETEPEDECTHNSTSGRSSGEQEPFHMHLPNLELPTQDQEQTESVYLEHTDNMKKLGSVGKPELLPVGTTPLSYVKWSAGVEESKLEGLKTEADSQRMGPPQGKPCHKPAKTVEFREQPKPVQAIRVRHMSEGYTTESDPEAPMDVSLILQTPERSRVGCHETPKSTKHPLRTPKEGVRRGPEPTSEKKECILGTPDYLAPEILLQEKHGPGVDWWALGVCLFEFLTGLPPFNDLSPERVFTNILNRAISWPTDMMGETGQAAINALLTMDPNSRPGAKEVKGMSFFSNLDWERLLETEAPFVPQPDDNMDTTYFEPKNSMQQLQISAVDM